MSDHMASTMTRLPDLAAPTSLGANVMARIARLPDERSSAAMSAVKTESSRGERLAWGLGLAGLVIAFGTYVHTELAAGTVPSLISSPTGHVQLVTISVEPAMLVLGLGLLLYLKGFLTVPQRGAREAQRSSVKR